MNLFKTTLLGVIVAGLTCANVSAKNYNNFEQAQAQTERKSSILSNFVSAGLNGVGASVALRMFTETLQLAKQAGQNLRLYDFCNNCVLRQCQYDKFDVGVYGTLSLLLLYLTYHFGSAAIEKLLKTVDLIEQRENSIHDALIGQ